MTRAYDFAGKCLLVLACWPVGCARDRAPLPPDASIGKGRVIVDAPGRIWTAAAPSLDGTRLAHFLWDAQRKAYDTLLRDAHTGAILWRNTSEKRRRGLTTREPLGDPIDLAPSDDEAHAIATSSDRKILMVGTERGVLLRFRIER
jgi:hypothetical protein